MGRNRGEKTEWNKREKSFDDDAGNCGGVENRTLEKRFKKNIKGFACSNNGTILEKVMVSQEQKS